MRVFATESGTAAERYESDSLTSVEAGIRLGNSGTSPISLNAALSHAWWSDIQADLIDERGLPYTTNLGDGGISGIELEASWQVTPRLRLDAAAFLNGSSLTDPEPAFADADETDLPNIAAAGGRIGANFRAELAEGADLSVDGAINYVGSSQLGIGAPLDVRQGDCFDSQIGARIGLGRLGISVDVDNLFDVRGNRFAFGNPFRLEARNQLTRFAHAPFASASTSHSESTTASHSEQHHRHPGKLPAPARPVELYLCGLPRPAVLC